MGRKPTLIVALPYELSQRWVDYFCMDVLCKEFEFQYWDCSKVMWPSFHPKTVVNRDYVKVINSLDAFEDKLKEIPKDSLISIDIHFNKENVQFYSILSKYFKNVNFVNFYGNIQSSERDKNKFVRYIGKISDYLEIKFSRFNKLLFIIQFLFSFGYKPYHKCIEKYYYRKCRSLFHFYIFSSNSNKFFINHPDVEQYYKIKLSKIDNESIGNYVLYIDQYFPLHPDLPEESPGIDYKSLAAPFYKSLNRFFDLVELKYNCKIVIAAHPSANYEKNPYGGRKLVYYKTPELVKNSRAVILHTSNAFSFAVLFDKPILLLTNNEFKSVSLLNNRMLNAHRDYGVQLIDIDKCEECPDIHHMTEDFRSTYIKKYFGHSNLSDLICNEKLMVNNFFKMYNIINK